MAIFKKYVEYRRVLISIQRDSIQYSWSLWFQILNFPAKCGKNHLRFINIFGKNTHIYKLLGQLTHLNYPDLWNHTKHHCRWAVQETVRGLTSDPWQLELVVSVKYRGMLVLHRNKYTTIHIQKLPKNSLFVHPWTYMNFYFHKNSINLLQMGTVFSWTSCFSTRAAAVEINSITSLCKFIALSIWVEERRRSSDRSSEMWGVGNLSSPKTQDQQDSKLILQDAGWWFGTFFFPIYWE